MIGFNLFIVMWNSNCILKELLTEINWKRVTTAKFPFDNSNNFNISLHLLICTQTHTYVCIMVSDRCSVTCTRLDCVGITVQISARDETLVSLFASGNRIKGSLMIVLRWIKIYELLTWTYNIFFTTRTC